MNKSKYGNEEKDRLVNLIPEEKMILMERFLSAQQFIVLNASLWNYRKPWQVPPRQINDNLIFLPLEGEFEISVDGTANILRRGDCVFIPEHITHSFYLHGDYSVWNNIILHILPLYPYQQNIFSGFNSPFQQLINPEAIIKQLCQAIAIRNRNTNLAFSYAADILRSVIIDAVTAGTYINKDLLLLSPRIEQACVFMHKNLSANISIEDIAESINLKAVQFRRVFQKETGQKPNVYLQRLRILNSARLLMRYDYNLDKVAEKSGFNSTSYFCTSFQKFFQMTPEQFRQKHR